MVLFAVGTVAVIDLIQKSQQGVNDGENVLIATHLAQRRLEELRNTAYGSLTNESEASILSPSGYSRFKRQVAVSTPYTNLTQIDVTVYWDAQGGKANVHLSTSRSNI